MPSVASLVVLIEFGGALVIMWGVGRALLTLVRTREERQARLLVIDGVLAGLGFKAAATLLKALELGTWHAIAMFAAILSLRTFLKHVLVLERGRVAAQS